MRLLLYFTVQVLTWKNICGELARSLAMGRWSMVDGKLADFFR